MSLARRRRAAVLLLAVLLTALFVLRPGVNGLRKRIVNSVSLALGRKVEVQWVKLRVLPQPGFDLVNFVVHDDPAFSPEPVLRAPEVTAGLRLRSLLRGRMEIGRLSLKEPSLNLVRGQNGHWNIESLLERAAHTEAAPTRNTLPERRPVFPYIEAEDGRINFKIGLEKKSYCLTDADFALWLESDDQWGMRMSAQPVRTDFNLSDTGTLQVNGTWRRSGSLRDTPLKFTFAWDGGQMGELTKLLYGRDRGWRGQVTLSADFFGTPARLKVTVKSAVDNFRRYDIVPQQSLRLASRCEARYSSLERALSDVVCRSSIGQGWVKVTGRIGAPTGPQTYDLSFALEAVPMQALVNLARRAKKNVPPDLSATGTMSGSFSVQSSPDQALQWSGSGQTEHFVLHSASSDSDLTLGSVPFSVQSLPSAEPGNSAFRAPRAENFRLQVGPLTIPLGKQSAMLQGWATASGYNLAIQGQGPVRRLLQMGQMAGLQVPQLNADGLAKVNLLVAGQWAGFAVPRPTGTAQLHSVSTQLPRLGGNVDIRSANLILDADTVQVKNITAVAAGANWEGSLSFPRPCHLLDRCPIHFDLHSDVVSLDRLQQWAGSRSHKRHWYSFMASGDRAPSLLSLLNASGTLAIKRAEIRGVTASRVTCNPEFHDGVVRLNGLAGDVLGGRHRGNWVANLRLSPPEFSGVGRLEHAALDQLAAAMHDGWIAGSANGTYQFSAAGASLRDALASATGTLQFEMRDGWLPHIVIASGAGPLHVRRFTGLLTLRNGKFELANGRLENGTAAYQVTGTASLGRQLQVKLTHAGGGFLIEGTLSTPHVMPFSAPDTRASLKP